MRLGPVKRLLEKWERNSLINAGQKDAIMGFMKIERKRQFLRLIKWLSILGAVWLVFGIIATLNLIDVNLLNKIWLLVKQIVMPVWNYVLVPLREFTRRIFGPNYLFAYYGFLSILIWALLFYLGLRRGQSRSVNEMKLSYFQGSHLKATMSLYVLSYIAAGCAFSFFNRLLLAGHVSYYASEAKIIPLFSMIAVGFFLYIAYRLRDQAALLFGIYFIAMSVGCVSAYTHACYWLAVSRPVLQLLTSIILILIGSAHLLQTKEEDYRYFFGRIYQWTGLLMGFLALWIMSIWGITEPKGGYWYDPSAFELWVANILFISASIGSMAYGAKSDDKLFFNYGLTFLIIETYTVFFDHLWASTGSAVGSLLLGVLLIATAHLLRNFWIRKNL